MKRFSSIECEEVVDPSKDSSPKSSLTIDQIIRFMVDRHIKQITVDYENIKARADGYTDIPHSVEYIRKDNNNKTK